MALHIVHQMNVCIADSTRKVLLPGAIPTLNLSEKSFETQSKPRRKIERNKLLRSQQLQVELPLVEYARLTPNAD